MFEIIVALITNVLKMFHNVFVEKVTIAMLGPHESILFKNRNMTPCATIVVAMRIDSLPMISIVKSPFLSLFQSPLPSPKIPYSFRKGKRYPMICYHFSLLCPVANVSTFHRPGMIVTHENVKMFKDKQHGSKGDDFGKGKADEVLLFEC